VTVGATHAGNLIPARWVQFFGESLLESISETRRTLICSGRLTGGADFFQAQCDVGCGKVASSGVPGVKLKGPGLSYQRKGKSQERGGSCQGKEKIHGGFVYFLGKCLGHSRVFVRE